MNTYTINIYLYISIYIYLFISIYIYLYIRIYIYIYIYIYAYMYITGQKRLMTHRVLKSYRNKMNLVSICSSIEDTFIAFLTAYIH